MLSPKLDTYITKNEAKKNLRARARGRALYNAVFQALHDRYPHEPIVLKLPE